MKNIAKSLVLARVSDCGFFGGVFLTLHITTQLTKY